MMSVFTFLSCPTRYLMLCITVFLFLYVGIYMHLGQYRRKPAGGGFLDPEKYKDSPQAQCVSLNHILFLKTHKTGSSTMANIFFRYGDFRNLTFVLGGETFVGWPEKFTLSSFLPLYGEKPHILCSHAKFNKEPMNWLFPKNTSKYITIVRNPVENFESVFSYMLLGRYFGITDVSNSLSLFFEKETIEENALSIPLIRNPMLHDLGLDLKLCQNQSAVNEYIHFLDREFDLVMIMDYFDESLVLMKRLLCWEMDDILYLKLNERQDKEKVSNLNENVKEKIARWNEADVLLFDYFNKTFWKKVEMEGSGFYEELAAFRRKNDEMKRICVTNETHHLQSVYAGKLVKGYALRADLPEKLQFKCEKLIMSENEYLANLRQKRHARLLNNAGF